MEVVMGKKLPVLPNLANCNGPHLSRDGKGVLGAKNEPGKIRHGTY